MEKIIALNEADLEETFSRASGPGGQNVNKVATRVTLRHIPTNISVSVQESRSQFMNRQLARERLLAAVQEQERKAHEAEKHRKAKLRRQQSKRPHGLKERILESKHHRSRRKQERKWTSD